MITPYQIAHLMKIWQINSADFFIEKIEKIRSQFQQSRPYIPPSRKSKNMTQFRPMSEEEILKNTEQHEENNM